MSYSFLIKKDFSPDLDLSFIISSLEAEAFIAFTVLSTVLRFLIEVISINGLITDLKCMK